MAITALTAWLGDRYVAARRRERTGVAAEAAAE
jgi:hypothetical protein